MPLTLTLSKNVLPPPAIKEAIQRLTHAMLIRHGLDGNSVMTPNITANVQIIQDQMSFSGGEEFKGAWIEWKVPSFAFAGEEIQKGYGGDAAEIIYELSGRTQPKENIYFNVVHTVDGAWNLNGEAMTNDELQRAIAAGA